LDSVWAKESSVWSGVGALLQHGEERLPAIKLVRPFAEEVPSLRKKSALLPLVDEVRAEVEERLGEEAVGSRPRFEDYKEEEAEKLITMKKAGKSDREIAEVLGRAYWSVVYKASTLRKAGRLS